MHFIRTISTPAVNQFMPLVYRELSHGVFFPSHQYRNLMLITYFKVVVAFGANSCI